MSDTPLDFEQMMRRVREGCPEASRELFDRYSEHIRRIVRRKLGQRMRRYYDSLDFVQNVWVSFYEIPTSRYNFQNPEELIAFLAQVAYRRVVDMQRLHSSLIRDSERELPIELGANEVEPDNQAQIASRQPSPSQLVIADERWQQLIEGQPPHCRRILEMLRIGHTYEEIAKQMDLHPKTIQRLIRKLTEQLDLP